MVAPPWSTLPWHVLVADGGGGDAAAGLHSRRPRRRGAASRGSISSVRRDERQAGIAAAAARARGFPAACAARPRHREEARGRWGALAAFYKTNSHFLVTNGPYKLKGWTPQSVTLEAFRDLTYPLGVGSYDAYAIPRRGFITRVEWSGERLTLSGDIEVIEKFQRSYRVVRTPISPSRQVLKRAAPECRYVVTNQRACQPSEPRRSAPARVPGRPEGPPAAGALHPIGAHSRQRQRHECRSASHGVRCYASTLAWSGLI